MNLRMKNFLTTLLIDAISVRNAYLLNYWILQKNNNLKNIIDGTNADDLNEYRPGLKALKELGIISPLAELGITKKKLDRMAKN